MHCLLVSGVVMAMIDSNYSTLVTYNGGVGLISKLWFYEAWA